MGEVLANLTLLELARLDRGKGWRVLLEIGGVGRGLQRGAFHVRVHELFGLLVRPSMVIRDDLELRAPSQEVLSRKVREILNLSIVWTRGPLERPVRCALVPARLGRGSGALLVLGGL